MVLLLGYLLLSIFSGAFSCNGLLEWVGSDIVSHTSLFFKLLLLHVPIALKVGRSKVSVGCVTQLPVMGELRLATIVIKQQVSMVRI